MRSLEEVPEVWGSIGRSEEKLKLGLKRVTCHRKIAGNWIQNGRRGKKIDGRMGEKRGRAIEKSSEVGPKTRKNEKKVDFTGQKTGASHRKIVRSRT